MIDVSWSFYRTNSTAKKIGLEESKSSVRAPRTRSERKNPTVRFPYNEFVLPRGLKNVVELSKIYSQLLPLCKFDTPGD